MQVEGKLLRTRVLMLNLSLVVPTTRLPVKSKNQVEHNADWYLVCLSMCDSGNVVAIFSIFLSLNWLLSRFPLPLAVSGPAVITLEKQYNCELSTVVARVLIVF